MSPRKTRLLLACLAASSTLFVVYASLVPLQYEPLDWNETWQRFLRIPWLRLGVGKRADWVANGLVMVPIGFFASGAIDWKRNSRRAFFWAAPIIVCSLSALVISIEYVQIWFPRRTLSLNDILAGILGSVGGVFLWSAVGRRTLDAIAKFYRGKPGFERIYMLIDAALIGLFVFSVMPLDVIVSSAELQQKIGKGRIVFLPFSDWMNQPDQFRTQLFGAAKLMPFAFFAGCRWPFATAARMVVIWAIALEAIQIPIYTRTASATDVLMSGILGVAAAGLAPRLMALWKRLDRATCWFIAALLFSGVTVVGFLSRGTERITDVEVLNARLMKMLTAVPFSGAYFSNEFTAGQSILLKLGVFAVLSFLITGWIKRVEQPSTAVAYRIVAVAWIGAVAVLVEIGQIFFVPLIPDTTDLVLYGVGAGLGACLASALIPPLAVPAK